MKIKSFECLKSIRKYEKKICGTSIAWSTIHLSHRPSEPAYYIVDCRISNPIPSFSNTNMYKFANYFATLSQFKLWKYLLLSHRLISKYFLKHI